MFVKTVFAVLLLFIGSSMAQKNVLGTPLEMCCSAPVTGFHRDGYCRVSPTDYGVHSVCAQVTQEFLDFSKSKGNDLITPIPPYFPGLKPGDCWCLCAARWAEALKAGVAPPVVLKSTNAKTLDVVSLDDLIKYAVDADAVFNP